MGKPADNGRCFKAINRTMLFWQKEDLLNFVEMKTKKIKKSAIPSVTVDKRLNNPSGKSYFSEKVKLAKERIKKYGLPDFIKEDIESI